MVTINPIGTKFQCPCGAWVGLTMTAGPAEYESDRMILPVSFDKDQFIQDFSDHVMTDPINENHAPFVRAVDDDDDCGVKRND